jgi:hypothetical protein
MKNYRFLFLIAKTKAATDIHNPTMVIPNAGLIHFSHAVFVSSDTFSFSICTSVTVTTIFNLMAVWKKIAFR